MQWIEFTVSTTDAGLEPVCGALYGANIKEVAIEDSIARIEAHLRELAPRWDFADAASLAGKDGPCVKAYIADLPENMALLQNARDAIAALRALDLGIDMGTLAITETRMDDENWANSWKQYYKPLPIGEKLLVCPSWEQAPNTARKVIRMDPGMAFGTGAHHTTRMCLELLEGLVTPGCSVLDIGCGSGILALAAALLGAKRTTLVDIDPVAERVIQNNFAQNGMGGADVYTGDILHDRSLQEAILGQYDIITANIVADVIIALAPVVTRYMHKGTHLIVSGIIGERAEEVLAALQEEGLTLRRRLFTAKDEALETEWVAFDLTYHTIPNSLS